MGLTGRCVRGVRMILDVEKHAKNYLQFIREKKCCACYSHPVDADHLSTVGMGNSRQKPRPADFTCIPLCRNCHIERHQIGIISFGKKHKVNLWQDAHRYLMEYYYDENYDKRNVYSLYLHRVVFMGWGILVFNHLVN